LLSIELVTFGILNTVGSQVVNLQFGNKTNKITTTEIMQNVVMGSLGDFQFHFLSFIFVAYTPDCDQVLGPGRVFFYFFAQAADMYSHRAGVDII